VGAAVFVLVGSGAIVAETAESVASIDETAASGDGATGLAARSAVAAMVGTSEAEPLPHPANKTTAMPKTPAATQARSTVRSRQSRIPGQLTANS
jgi:hypothetical protein